jgi:hypothetical protein
MTDPPSSSSLATILSLPQDLHGEVTKEWLSDAIEHCAQHDDLWNPKFMQGVVFNIQSSRNISISSAAEAWLEEHDTEWVHFHTADDGHPALRQGPHLFLDGNSREVMRLYEDTYGTFMFALDPDQQRRVTMCFCGS